MGDGTKTNGQWLEDRRRLDEVDEAIQMLASVIISLRNDIWQRKNCYQSEAENSTRHPSLFLHRESLARMLDRHQESEEVFD